MAQIQEGYDQRTTDDVRSGAKHITRRILLIASKVSVEPTVFLTMFTSIMYQLITQNLYLEKSCRVNIGFNTSICDALSDKNSSGYSKREEVEVQKLVSQMLALRTALQSFFPVCLILFIGSWSDRNNRRKPVILAPIFGEIMCCGFLILNVVFFYELPLIFTTLGDSLPLALLGGWPCLFVGVYTFIGTRCSKENRTIRVGIVSACKMGAHSLGLASAGLIYRAFGFIGFFSLCISLLLMSLTLAMVLIKDEDRSFERKKEIGPLKDFFDVRYFKETFKISFKNGPNNQRLKIIIIMILVMVVTGPVHGELNVIYMYTRYMFDWDAVQYGIFCSVQICVEISGSIMAVIFFCKYLGYDDTFLGVIGLAGTVLSNVIFALAPSPRYFFLGIITSSLYMNYIFVDCLYFSISIVSTLKNTRTEITPDKFPHIYIPFTALHWREMELIWAQYIGINLFNRMPKSIEMIENYRELFRIFVDFFHLTTYVSMRSMMSKIVPPNELGQSNSVFGVCEAIMPLIFGPTYTMIYKYTIDIFPGTFYFFTATIKFTGLCLFIWLYLIVQKEKTGERNPELKIISYKVWNSSEDISKEQCGSLMKNSQRNLDDQKV